MLRLRFPMLFAGVLVGLYAVLRVFATMATFSMLYSGVGLVTPSWGNVMTAIAFGLSDSVTTGLAALLLCVSAGYGFGARSNPALVLQSARYLRYFWWAFLASWISGWVQFVALLPSTQVL